MIFIDILCEKLRFRMDSWVAKIYETARTKFNTKIPKRLTGIKVKGDFVLFTTTIRCTITINDHERQFLIPLDLTSLHEVDLASRGRNSSKDEFDLASQNSTQWSEVDQERERLQKVYIKNGLKYQTRIFYCDISPITINPDDKCKIEIDHSCANGNPKITPTFSNITNEVRYQVTQGTNKLEICIEDKNGKIALCKLDAYYCLQGSTSQRPFIEYRDTLAFQDLESKTKIECKLNQTAVIKNKETWLEGDPERQLKLSLGDSTCYAHYTLSTRTVIPSNKLVLVPDNQTEKNYQVISPYFMIATWEEIRSRESFSSKKLETEKDYNNVMNEILFSLGYNEGLVYISGEKFPFHISMYLDMLKRWSRLGDYDWLRGWSEELTSRSVKLPTTVPIKFKYQTYDGEFYGLTDTGC
jgi:hypothetical protein